MKENQRENISERERESERARETEQTEHPGGCSTPRAPQSGLSRWLDLPLKILLFASRFAPLRPSCCCLRLVFAWPPVPLKARSPTAAISFLTRSWSDFGSRREKDKNGLRHVTLDIIKHWLDIVLDLHWILDRPCWKDSWCTVHP